MSAYSDMLTAAALAELGILVWVQRPAKPIRIPRASLFFVALALTAWIQFGAGKVAFFGDAWIVSLYLLCAAMATLWAANLATRDGLLLALTIAILIASLVSCLLAGIQRWNIDVGPWGLYVLSVKPGRAPFANLGQPNQLATLLALGLASNWYLYEERRIRAPSAASAALLLTITLALTQSRTALLLWVAGIGWHGWFYRRLSLRTRLTTICILALVWMASFLAVPTITELMGIDNYASTASRLEPGPRTTLWPQMLAAIGQSPLFGYGWNQIGFAQLDIAKVGEGMVFSESAHNIVLDLALWLGLPLALVATVLGVTWLFRTFQRAQTAEVAFSLLIVCLLLAHALVEFPLTYLYFLVPFSLAVGVASADARPRISLQLPLTATPILLLILIGVLGWSLIDYLRVEDQYREMRMTVARYGKVMPSSPPGPLSTQFTQLGSFYSFSLTEPNRRYDQPSLEFFRSVAYRYPYAPALYRYAFAQALSGDSVGAKSTMMALRAMYGDRLYEQGRLEIVRLAAEGYPILQRVELPTFPPATTVR